MTTAAPGASAAYPATDFSNLTYSYQYLYENPSGAACTAPTQMSSVVGDSSNSFCIDPAHIAPLSTYYTDLTGNTLPSFAFIEAGYGNNDEHPGSGQSILLGQAQVASVVNTFMASPEWKDSVFFLSYDEGGGPYDHVPPVPGHSNENTDAVAGNHSGYFHDRRECRHVYALRTQWRNRNDLIAICQRVTPGPMRRMPRRFRALPHSLDFACPT